MLHPSVISLRTQAASTAAVGLCFILRRGQSLRRPRTADALTPWRTLDSDRMSHEALQLIRRLNPNFTDLTKPVRAMSGGQRQTVAIARALYFNARILISHDSADVFEVCDRVTVMKNGAVVDTVRIADVTQGEILAMTILGQKPQVAA